MKLATSSAIRGEQLGEAKNRTVSIQPRSMPPPRVMSSFRQPREVILRSHGPRERNRIDKGK